MKKIKCFSQKTDHADAVINLFCFHHAGGAASYFNVWKDVLSKKANLFSIQLPGREDRMDETFHQTTAEVVEELLQYEQFFRDKPMILFGHSMGSLIAFELARILQENPHVTLLGLIASGHRAPHLPLKFEKISNLPDAEFIDVLQKRYGGIAKEVLECPEILEFLLPRLRADNYLAENYLCDETRQLSIPLHVFGGESDPSVDSNELESWGEQASLKTNIHQFPGEHFFINSSRDSVLLTLNNIIEASVVRKKLAFC